MQWYNVHMLHLWRAILYWLEIHTGTTNEPGPYYGFWSGFGSDIAEFGLLFGVLGLYKHHNCPVKGCPRITHKKFPVKGTPLYTCHHHATKKWHTLLAKEYKRDHAEQHALYNERV